MSDYLPRKVLIDILARLPVKSLLRFRCVCKSWRSLISTPVFIAAHINHSTISNANTRLLLLRHYSHRKERFSLHFDNETFEKRGELKFPSVARSKLYFRVVGSCNGLVCLTDDCFGYTNTIILWNPSIRRSLALPLPKITLDSGGPLICVHGFGVDLNKNDHKFVRFSYLEGEDGFRVPPRVEIFTLGEQSWRDFKGFVPKFGISDYFWSQAYLIGKVHWVAYKLFDRVASGCFILLFDLGDEIFSEMELPECLVHQFPRNMVTKVMGKSLSVIQYDARAYSKRCAIWVMKEYGVVESWIKLYDIDLDGRLVMMLGWRTNGELLLGMGKELVSYDPASQEVEKLGVRGSKDAFCVDDYMESLVLLEEGAEVMGGLASSSNAATSTGEPAFSEEEDGPGDGAAEKYAYFMQTVMLDSSKICL